MVGDDARSSSRAWLFTARASPIAVRSVEREDWADSCLRVCTRGGALWNAGDMYGGGETLRSASWTMDIERVGERGADRSCDRDVVAV
jgi:hypothetical protein